MGQLYLEFDEKELKKNLELFKRIQNEKNGDLEEAFKLFADKYINGEMDLAVFLQIVNYNLRSYCPSYGIIIFAGELVSLYKSGIQQAVEKLNLLPLILKIKEFHDNRNEKVDVNIYELLISIYYCKDDEDNCYKLSKELLSIDNKNKIAKNILARYEEMEYIKNNFYTSDLAILNNIALFNMKNKNIDKSLEYYEYIVNTIRNTITKIKKDGYISSPNSLYDIYIGDFNPCKYNKYIVYMCKKGKKYQYNRYYIDINKKVKVFPNYCWKAPFFDYPYLRQTLSSLGNCYHYKFKEDKKIENYKKAEELYLESIEFMIRNCEDEFDLCVDPWGDYILAFDPIYLVPAPIFIDRWIKDTIINLINLYYENNEYKKGKSLDDCSNLLTKNFDCDSLLDYINIINKIAGKIVIDNSIEIKNKKVLIDIYEIMSVSRKELIVIHLFDYIRSADAKNHNVTTVIENHDEVTRKPDKKAKWKAKIVKTNYKENEYTLYYHIQSAKDKKIWELPPKEIAINQIRNTLTHGYNDYPVDKVIETPKNAREFIEANFTSIIECLFNVIKENELLSEPKIEAKIFD